jgi:hypothetical protein
MPDRNLCDNMKQKVTASWRSQWMEMKAGSTTNLKWRRQAKNGTIPAHWPKKILYRGICGKSDTVAILDHQDPLLELYRSKGITFTSALHRNLLRHLRPAIRSKHRGLLSTGVLLLHNAKPCTAHVTVETIKNINFECLPHPPYTPTSPLVTTSLNHSRRL